MISKWRGGFILGDNQQAVDKINSVSAVTGIEPRWIKVHNSVKHIKQLRQSCPNTHLIIRLTAPEWKFQSYIRQLETGGTPSPKISAADYYASLKLLIDSDTQRSNLWLESCPPGFQSWEFSTWLNEYFLEFMRLCETDGFRAMVCNFYTGTPHTISDGIDGWSPFMPTVNYAAAHGHIIGAHAYFQLPDTAMLDTDHWTGYRPLRVIQDYNFPVGTVWVPGEWSFDGPGGYRAHNISEPDMRAAWNRASNTFRGTYVDGFVGYILQAWGTEWDNFLYWAIFDQLLQDMVEAGGDSETQPPTPPVPPPTGTYVSPTALLNIRRGPGVNYPVSGTFATSERSLVTEEAVSSIGKQASWIWIEIPACEGWAAAWYLRKV